jgi:hypothetical protein
MRSGIEQWYVLTRFWIFTIHMSPFMSIAVGACQCQIIQLGQAASGSGQDMINLKASDLKLG